jgi:inward rectifier potassium channel
MMTKTKRPSPPFPSKYDKGHLLSVGERQYRIYGIPKAYWQDVYHHSMTINWPAFLCIAGALFLLINLFFTCLYLLGTAPISHTPTPIFWGTFFFSVETFATVGYGDMHPQTLYGHAIATLETFFGIMSTALITGLMFSRFTRPRARILFVNTPVIGPVNGLTTLSIRTANARQNVIVEASARLSLLINETTLEGITMRRFKKLHLERNRHPAFLLGWTLMHTIQEGSPLFNLSAEDLAKGRAELVLTLEGADETTGQTILSKHHYMHNDILWNHRYSDLLRLDEQGVYHTDYRKFHETIPLDL